MQQPRICSFGEILWDLFEQDAVIGGAPFNFAAHLQKLGASVTLVSAVGQDELGERAKDALRAFGMDPSAVATLGSTDSSASSAKTAGDVPTGYCQVTLQNGAPSYTLVRDVAYDFIPLPAPALLSRPFDALYFGTLAARAQTSRETLFCLLRKNIAREVFFDINIRGEHWSPALLNDLLPFATVLKFSREEAWALQSIQNPRRESVPQDRDMLPSLCRQLTACYPHLRLVLVTLDLDGALLYDRAADAFLSAPKPQSRAVSTVGAGDSFSACFLYHLLRGAPLPDCLSRATALSDYVVTQLGAVPDYPPELLKAVRGD